jgi:predicted HTH transcriptional regulator
MNSWLDQFSDSELLSRLRNTEDAFVERKTRSDTSDWLKAAVALANSTPIDYPAILFIGVRDKGDIEGGNCNYDRLQKTFSEKLAKAYPAIYYLPKALRVGAAECLAVIIPGSRNRPHFAGPSYVRVGSETKRASEEQFAVLIAERTSKVYRIRQFKGKTIKIQNWTQMRGSIVDTDESGGTLTDCNEHYVTVEISPGMLASFPLSRVDISFDHESGTLELGIEQR